MSIYEDPLDRTLHTKEIVKQLRKEIILGKYQPGSRLVEATLAKQMGYSRAPIRTSLQILAQEGLVLNLPNGGTEVIGFSAKDFVDLFDLRLVLEKMALESILVNTAFNYRPLFDIMETLDHHRRKSKSSEIPISQTSSLDIQFHRSLISMVENNPLRVAWNSMANVFQTVLEITNMTSNSFEEFYNDHRKLADLIIQKNPECIDELVKHISRSKNILVDRIEKVLENTEQ